VATQATTIGLASAFYYLGNGVLAGGDNLRTRRTVFALKARDWLFYRLRWADLNRKRAGV
jgi:hypothetical protein